MPETKSGSNLRQINRWQREAARAEYLRHPDSSIADVAKATNVALRTVARARETLVKEGLLTPGRNATASGADAAAMTMAAQAVMEAAPEVAPEVAAARGSKQGHTIDGEALRKMNELLDEMADEDDEVTRKRMLRQMKKFAFDPELHPDTRMSASQLWAKLLDMARAKDLGPGIPVTLEAAIIRCTDFLRACGAKVAVPAFYAAFDLGDVPNDASTPTAVEPSQSPPATIESSGPADNDTQVRPEA